MMTTTTISEEYRKLNQDLHRVRPDYGLRGYQHAARVIQLAGEYQCGRVLDYGCGKATLEHGLRELGSDIPVVSYVPCIPEYAQDPDPCDLVLCTDVLEHVEPELTGDCLRHIRGKTLKVAWFKIATAPDRTKLLPDGRNPHVNLVSADRWAGRLLMVFRSVVIQKVRSRHCELLAAP
jgi:hypothetical protein